MVFVMKKISFAFFSLTLMMSSATMAMQDAPQEVISAPVSTSGVPQITVDNLLGELMFEIPVQSPNGDVWRYVAADFTGAGMTGHENLVIP